MELDQGRIVCVGNGSGDMGSINMNGLNLNGNTLKNSSNSLSLIEELNNVPKTFCTIQALWNQIHSEPNVCIPKAFHCFASSPANLYKNRYGNVLPYPQTRVVLGTDCETDSSYINANWVQGISTIRYIASQAPLPNTFCDFWQMIYENKTRVILMLTRLNESGKAKADQYWADLNETHNFRHISVTLVEELQIQAEITLRRFTIYNTSESFPNSSPQTVVQIHYTGWPDFGTPECAHQFMETILLTEKYYDNSPILLHCSAGLGRTGTWIAAHMVYTMIKEELVNGVEQVNIKEMITELRRQRRGMIQTLDQMTFLCNVIQELFKRKEIEAQEQQEEEERQKKQEEEQREEEEERRRREERASSPTCAKRIKRNGALSKSCPGTKRGVGNNGGGGSGSSNGTGSIGLDKPSGRGKLTSSGKSIHCSNNHSKSASPSCTNNKTWSPKIAT